MDKKYQGVTIFASINHHDINEENMVHKIKVGWLKRRRASRN